MCLGVEFTLFAAHFIFKTFRELGINEAVLHFRGAVRHLHFLAVQFRLKPPSFSLLINEK
jgi:hypothetical protein